MTILATITTKTVVCDIGLTRCPTDDLESYRVSKGRKTWSVTLCREHRKTLDAILEKSEKEQGSNRARIWTPDEIAARRTSG